MLGWGERVPLEGRFLTTGPPGKLPREILATHDACLACVLEPDLSHAQKTYISAHLHSKPRRFDQPHFTDEATEGRRLSDSPRVTQPAEDKGRTQVRPPCHAESPPNPTSRFPIPRAPSRNNMPRRKDSSR